MEDAFLSDEKMLWKCQKHLIRDGHGGVCSKCLCDRLRLLCPGCAHVSPCRGLQSSSSAFSSFSSLSSFEPPRSSVGAVGRIGNLIDGEPAFLRSRSTTFRFLQSRSDFMEGRRRRRIWAAFWPFSKDAPRREEMATPENILRSRSVEVTCSSDTAGEHRGMRRPKKWRGLFQKPALRLFRNGTTEVG